MFGEMSGIHCILIWTSRSTMKSQVRRTDQIHFWNGSDGSKLHAKMVLATGSRLPAHWSTAIRLRRRLIPRVKRSFALGMLLRRREHSSIVNVVPLQIVAVAAVDATESENLSTPPPASLSLELLNGSSRGLGLVPRKNRASLLPLLLNATPMTSRLPKERVRFQMLWVLPDSSSPCSKKLKSAVMTKVSLLPHSPSGSSSIERVRLRDLRQDFRLSIRRRKQLRLLRSASIAALSLHSNNILHTSHQHTLQGLTFRHTPQLRRNSGEAGAGNNHSAALLDPKTLHQHAPRYPIQRNPNFSAWSRSH